MSFLFPSFLWALLTLAIPIAIHFFNFRKTQRVYFSNVSFLKAIEIKTKSIRKLKQWLVLMMRMLAITALVLAFAQPYFANNESLDNHKRGITSLYIDNSFSMENELNGKRYIDIATSKLDEILSKLKDQSAYQLVTNDFSTKEQSVYNTSEVRDMLTTLPLSPISRNLESVYQRQKNLLAKKTQQNKNQLFWISDFQKSTSDDLKKIKIDTSENLYIVPIQAKIQKNIFVDSVWLNTPFIRELQNNILFVKVHNSGNEEVENVVLRLTLDSTQASSASVDIPAQGNAIAQFNFNIKGKGFKKGHILFDDYPVTFDNDFYFVLDASPRINILHIQGQNSKTDFIHHVYDNDSLFAYSHYNEQNVDAGKIQHANLVILEGMENISVATVQALEKFVKSGGSLTIIPPAHPQETTYRTFLTNFGIYDISISTSTQSNPVELSLPDRKNPFFTDVFDDSAIRETNVNLPTADAVWSWNTAGENIISLRNGKSFLSQILNGTGKVNLFSTPFINTYGNFAQHALFVPVMYKLAALSIQSSSMAFTFDQNPISIKMDEIKPNDIYKLKHDGLEIIPNQRIVGNELLLELPQGDQTSKSLSPGYYELVLDNKTKAWIALNHNNDESKLDYYSPTELKKMFASHKNVKIFDSIEENDFSNVLHQQDESKSIWRYFLIGALIFLLAEILIIRFNKTQE